MSGCLLTLLMVFALGWIMEYPVVALVLVVAGVIIYLPLRSKWKIEDENNRKKQKQEEEKKAIIAEKRKLTYKQLKFEAIPPINAIAFTIVELLNKYATQL